MNTAKMWPEDADAFREAVREWLAENCPQSMRTPMRPEEMPFGGSKGHPAGNPDIRIWLERVASRGLALPMAPVEYGGAGLDGPRAAILAKEMRRIHARPPLMGGGVSLIAPALLIYGTEEQKRRHVPAIARGETSWCQGFSEPEAGSDLVSLRLRAVRDGDEFVLNGQKTWTSKATVADWMFCLARTAADAPKQSAGISMFLVDMATPGITIRPMRLINGIEEFCETHFDNVRVPANEMLGAENEGWNVAKTILMFERAAMSELGGAAWPFPLLETFHELAVSSPEIAVAVARNELDQRALEATIERMSRMVRSGDLTGAARLANVIKVVFAEHTQRRAELLTLLREWDGSSMAGEVEPESLDTTRNWLAARAWSIAGGTTEIQLNIISKRDLGLPAS
ncbi:acyl-CoA dehydrogenase family protein [Nocardia sp. NPDC051030]|uniref:acyl-CoA dehydrogenase family protein n=1 Tax=Nocardia sp. NPDC051030 TaxID=3155162 RepID=UPI003416C3F2